MRKDPGPLFTNVASHCRRDLNRSNTELTFKSESLCLILTPTGTGSLRSACLLLLCYFSLSFNCWPSITLIQLTTTILLWNSSSGHRAITWLSVCLPIIYTPIVYFFNNPSERIHYQWLQLFCRSLLSETEIYLQSYTCHRTLKMQQRFSFSNLTDIWFIFLISHQTF